MTTITKEEVKAFIEQIESDLANGWEAQIFELKLARIALTSLNATPIYQVQYGQQWRDVSEEVYEDHRDHGSSTRIVYAEPPARDNKQTDELVMWVKRLAHSLNIHILLSRQICG